MNDMIYADVPKDLTKIKTKLAFGLTKRQIICFGSGALIGIPLYFLTKRKLPGSLSMFLMIAVMMPFFLFALYEKNGQPLEKILKNVIASRFRRVKYRPYQTENIYAAILRQAEINKEVSAIVRKEKRNRKPAKANGQADAGAEETTKRPDRAGEQGQEQPAHGAADNPV